MKYHNAALLIFFASISVTFAQTHAPSNSTIIAELRTNNLSAEEVIGVTGFDDLVVVSLEKFSGRSLQDLESVLANTEDGFAEIRAATARNPLLKAALTTEGVNVRDVVAVTLSELEILTIYVDHPALI